MAKKAILGFQSWRTVPLSETEAQPRPTLAIAATFTAEPLEEPLSFWLDELDLPHEIRFAPYNQIFQAMLDPHGLLHSNTNGVNVVLVRTEDWAEARAEAAQRFSDVLRETNSAADWIVAVCPGKSPEQLRPIADSLPAVHFAFPQDILSLYAVDAVHDPSADLLGHVPYSPEFFVALATWIARRIHGLSMAPYKVLALDCDNTLWRGICGEDGPTGVVIDSGRRALQEFALAQRDAGMLLCLCSKNNESDVFETIRAHSEAVLRPEHFAAWRINWDAKSANLPALAAEVDLGLDSFIFIDDDRRECAEVIADCPAVLTLPLPEASTEIADFLRHVWAFDHPRITEADRRRAEQYLQSAERRRAERQAGSFADFIASLQLEVRIDLATSDQLPRVAQLTQRTNQMNFTSVRRSEAELRTALLSGALECLTVEVTDRFGDYGLVGVMLVAVESSTLVVDTFLLSCRALGRGVEHRMLAYLGEFARFRAVESIRIPFRSTQKNAPARTFLQSLALEDALNDLGAADAARIRWQPSAPPGKASIHAPVAPRQRRFDDYLRIATELRTVEQISARLRQRRRRSRATAIPAEAAPRNEIETRLILIWMDLLGLDAVGRDENFFDLGGHSLLAIQLLSRIRQDLGIDLSLDVVYGGPLTVAELARTIELGELSSLSPTEYDALLAEIDAMPEEEVRALLEAEGGTLDS